MTRTSAEAVIELAEALDQPYDLQPVDTELSTGDVFVDPPGPGYDGQLRIIVPAKIVCWVVSVGMDRHPFRDPVAAMVYLRVLGVRKEDT